MTEAIFWFVGADSSVDGLMAPNLQTHIVFVVRSLPLSNPIALRTAKLVLITSAWLLLYGRREVIHKTCGFHR